MTARNYGVSRRPTGDSSASGSFALRGQHEIHSLRSPRSLTFSEPLKAIQIPNAPFNKGIMLRNLLLMLFFSAAFLGAAFFADFVSTFIQFP